MSYAVTEAACLRNLLWVSESHIVGILVFCCLYSARRAKFRSDVEEDGVGEEK